MPSCGLHHRCLMGAGVVAWALLAGCAGSPDPAVPRQLMAAIEACEWDRVADEELLVRALDDPEARVRARALRACGRVRWAGGPERLAAVLAGDSSASPAEQAEACFALGQLGEAAAFPALRQCMLATDRPPEVRARAAEAIGKLVFETPASEKGAEVQAGAGADTAAASAASAAADSAAEARAALARGLEDPDPQVRGAAGLALWRRKAIDQVAALAAALAREEDPEARWRLVYALARIDYPATLPPLRLLTVHPDPWVQTFAAWGMQTPPDPENLGPLAALLARPGSFWTARVHALRGIQALRKKFPELIPRSREVLLAHLFRDAHPLVEEALWDAVAEGGGADDRALAEAAAASSPEPTARRAAIRAAGRLGGAAAIEFLRVYLESPDPGLRSSALEGLAHGGDGARTLIRGALDDGDASVQEAAVRALAAAVPDADTWAELSRRAATTLHLNVRGAVLELLVQHRPEGWLDALVAAYPAARTVPAEWENRVTILQALAEDPRGAGLATQALAEDPSPVVRRCAARVLAAPPPESSFQRAPYGAADRFPALDQEHVLQGERPRIHFETTRGTFVVELYLEAAPLHVSSIIHLARLGFYEGLPFHRVVPGFVVQGGDPRGNGWGDAGYHLVDEINPLPFLRGTVGMPKATDPDTGGCQLFITHLPTPHLDGRYTVLGRVVLGMEVVDALQVGDRILKARVQENRFREAEAGR